MRLAHPADRRTVAVMALATAVAVAHWLAPAFNAALFAAAIALAFSVTAMHHNHAHSPLWRGRVANAATDAWFTLFQGHPGYMFVPMHVDNHHAFHNGPRDLTRTDLHRAANDLPGLLLHPFEFAAASAAPIGCWLREVARTRPRLLAGICAHYALLLGVDAMALAADAPRALAVVVLPQAGALFWLFASNYLQHAHACADSEFAHARNFLGGMNLAGFNVGYHTAHHHAPDKHWSELPGVHAALADRIPPALVERGLARYMGRVFVLGSVFPRYRSVPVDRPRIDCNDGY